MYKILVLVVTAYFFTGCIVKPTLESKSIRIVDKQTDYKCKFITTVTGSGSMGWTTAHDAEGAMNEVRNDAAKAGANAIRIININSDMDTTVVVAEALKCKFNY
jgi:uncharacterized protein YbjQ (UPF0145 family)